MDNPTLNSKQFGEDVYRFEQAVVEFTASVGRLPETQPNRIGSSCWYRPADSIPYQWRGGKILAWSTDFDQPNGEGDQSIALFPVAVIEDDETGKCHSIYVTRVCFAAVPPTEGSK